MLSRLHTIPGCDGRTDATSIINIVCADVR